MLCKVRSAGIVRKEQVKVKVTRVLAWSLGADGGLLAIIVNQGETDRK
jgi:hypothetical protein